MKKIVFLILLLTVSFSALAKPKNLLPNDRAVFHNNQGVNYMTQGDLERAKQEFLTAVELSSGYAEAYNNLGVVAKKEGALEKAKEYFEKSISINKDYASAYSHLGTVYMDQGKFDIALQKFKTAIKKDRTFADGYYNMAVCYLEMTKKNPKKDYLSEAETAFKKATDLNPRLEYVHYEIAEVYRTLGRYENAVIRYKLALGDNPNSLKAWMRLGTLYLEMSDPFKAQNCFQKAISLVPNNLDAHMHLGLFYMNEKRYKEAYSEFYSVTILNPFAEVAFFRMGTVALALAEDAALAGDNTESQRYYNDAEASLKRAKEINPQFADASYNLGVAYLKRGQTVEAQTEWEYTVKVDPNHVRTLYNLGTLYSQAGQKEKASELLCKFSKLAGPELSAEKNVVNQLYKEQGIGCRN